MAERYDAAIIGAGADGLAAAILLARAGLRVAVVERHAEPGGRLVTREFHPGYYASPFASAVAPIPGDLFWQLDLARHGALLGPALAPVALWPDRAVTLAPSHTDAEAGQRRAAALAHAHLPSPKPRWNPFAKPAREIWPPESWTHRALADGDDDQTALRAAVALEGRSADPLSAGSALNLLSSRAGGVWRGGLGGLGAALIAAARAAGAELLCGLEVGDIRCVKDRAAALALADGSEIAARAVISTLDLKRTFLSLFAWSALLPATVKQIGHFRMSGASARLLVALAALPKIAHGPPDLLRRPIHLMPSLASRLEAYAAWRSGVLAERLPLILRFESATDPGLAPIGAATLSVTISGVPHTLFDGVWTHDKRERLVAQTLAAIEEVFPGLTASVLATELIAPPDIETALGLTNGDLDGGEIAPDQMFAFRPGFLRKSPYTPVSGLYLAGPSSAAAPFGTCAAGAIAAEAVLADIKAGLLP